LASLYGFERMNLVPKMQILLNRAAEVRTSLAFLEFSVAGVEQEIVAFTTVNQMVCDVYVLAQLLAKHTYTHTQFIHLI